MQRYLFSAYYFPVLLKKKQQKRLSQTATFEILRYLCDVMKHFIFPYFKKKLSLFINDIKEFRKRGGQVFNRDWY